MQTQPALPRDMGSIVSRLRQFIDAVDEIREEEKRGPFERGSKREQQESLTGPGLDTFRRRMYPAYLHDELAEQRQPLLGRSDFFSKVASPVYQHGGISPYVTPGQWVYPEYNFSEIGIAKETEPLVARAAERKIELALKEGYSFGGKNPRTVDYLKQRMSEITYCGDCTTESLVEQMLTDLTDYSNFWGVWVRDARRSSGRRRIINGRSVPPISAVFPVPAETVMLKHDEKGNIVAIAQESWGSSKRVVWGNNNFFHMKRNYRLGMSVGTPALIPVFDDIEALRRIEEDVEILLYQHLFPLYHHKVGNDKLPASDYPDESGKNEIEQVKETWGKMPTEGSLVTSHRHEINVLGARSAAIEAYNYLVYFKSRVLGGIGISGLDIGEASTSNRSTSDSLSRVLVDGVKYLQRKMKHQFEQYVIRSLMLESTFPEREVLLEENCVFLEFSEIDIDSKIKKENHANTMFTAHGTTRDEYRRDLGREPLSEEESSQTYFGVVEEPKLLLSSKTGGHTAEAMALAAHPHISISPENIAFEQAYEKEQAKAAMQQKQMSSSSGGSGKESSGVREAKERNRPSNQHGRKAGPEGRKSSVIDGEHVDTKRQEMIPGNIAYRICRQADSYLVSQMTSCNDALRQTEERSNDATEKGAETPVQKWAKQVRDGLENHYLFVVAQALQSAHGVRVDSMSSVVLKRIQKRASDSIKFLIDSLQRWRNRWGYQVADGMTEGVQGPDFWREVSSRVSAYEDRILYLAYIDATVELFCENQSKGKSIRSADLDARVEIKEEDGASSSQVTMYNEINDNFEVVDRDVLWRQLMDMTRGTASPPAIEIRSL